jgi:hypothetical protein
MRSSSKVVDCGEVVIAVGEVVIPVGEFVIPVGEVARVRQATKKSSITKKH